MTKEELQSRTKVLAVKVYKLCKNLEKGLDQNVIGHQLLKSSTSVGANYRAACRARSTKEFIAKLSICIGEWDETMYWLEFLDEIGQYDQIEDMRNEANELLAIFISSRKTAKSKL